ALRPSRQHRLGDRGHRQGPGRDAALHLRAGGDLPPRPRAVEREEGRGRVRRLPGGAARAAATGHGELTDLRAVVSRVAWARVVVGGSGGLKEWSGSPPVNDIQVTGEIGPGLLVLVGVGREDGPDQAVWLADKLAGLRVF